MSLLLLFPSAGAVTHQGAVSFTGASTFGAAGAAQLAAAWSVTGAATFAAAGVRKRAGALAVTGAATFLAAGSRKTTGAIALQGVASFGADGVIAGAGVVHQGTVVFAGGAAVALDAVVRSYVGPDVDMGGARVVLRSPQPPALRPSLLTTPAAVAGIMVAQLPRPTMQFEGDVDTAPHGAFASVLPRPIAEGVGLVGDGDEVLCELVALAVAAAGDAWRTS